MTEGEKIVVAGLIVALATIGGGAALRRLTRGIRNNNPGNIRRTGINWLGEVPEPQKTDPEFEQFTAPEYGIRAMRKEIEANYNRGENTVEQIINEWAPQNENDTRAYIDFVSSRLGVAPGMPLARFHIRSLIDAIIERENGFNPYPSELIERGLSLA